MYEAHKTPVKTIASPKRNARPLVQAALFAVLVGVGAHIRIPTPLMPFTLQTPIVLMGGILLGPRTGALALSLYLLLGLIGLPVFTSGGGLQAVMTPTFGFLLGFPFAAWVSGRVNELLRTKHTALKAGALADGASYLAGACVLYTAGLAYLWFYLAWVAGKDVAFGQLLKIGLIPFLPFECLKGAAVVALCRVIRLRVQKRA